MLWSILIPMWMSKREQTIKLHGFGRQLERSWFALAKKETSKHASSQKSSISEVVVFLSCIRNNTARFTRDTISGKILTFIKLYSGWQLRQRNIISACIPYWANFGVSTALGALSLRWLKSKWLKAGENYSSPLILSKVIINTKIFIYFLNLNVLVFIFYI